MKISTNKLAICQIVRGHVHLALPEHHVARSVALNDLDFLLFLTLHAVSAFLLGNSCRLGTLSLEPVINKHSIKVQDLSREATGD